MTVGDLRKAIKNLSDDTPVVDVDPFGYGIQYDSEPEVKELGLVEYAWSRKRSEPVRVLVLHGPDTGPIPD